MKEWTLVEPREWKRRSSYGGCVFHDDPLDCGPPLQSHHIISQQKLRGIGRSDLLWALENSMCLCYRAHRRHDLALERVPYVKVPPAAIRFAAELGLEWWIEKRYPRLEAGDGTSTGISGAVTRSD